MKIRNILLATALVLGFTACIPSVRPFYTAKDVVFEPRLIGTWGERDESADGTKWKFESAGTNTYKLTLTEDKGKKGEFNATLFKLKEQYFIDLVPSKCEFAENQADMVAWTLVAGHLLVRVTQFEPELEMAFFDFDKLDKMLKANPKVLAHHREEDRVVIIAETAALQKFVMKHSEDGELFGDKTKMVRK